MTTCFGIANNVTSVCSSHGSCVKKDTCSCSGMYVGDRCQVTSCYDIYSNDSSVEVFVRITTPVFVIIITMATNVKISNVMELTKSPHKFVLPEDPA